MIYENIKGINYPINRVISGGGVNHEINFKYENINGIYKEVYSSKYAVKNGVLINKKLLLDTLKFNQSYLSATPTWQVRQEDGYVVFYFSNTQYSVSNDYYGSQGTVGYFVIKNNSLKTMHMDFLGFHVTTTNGNTRFDLWFNGTRCYNSGYGQTNLTYNTNLAYVINAGGGYEFFDIWHGNKNKGKCTMTFELKIKNFYVE